MSFWRALGSGLAGACALTLVHEGARRVFADAPRVDLLGMRALARSYNAVGAPTPAPDELFNRALVGEIVGNALYYSAVGWGARDGAWLRGALLGLAAGVGAAALPGPLGLGSDASARTPATQAMTIAWYTLGGLTAAAAYEFLTDAGISENDLELVAKLKGAKARTE
ncbi:MAG TPA: hypothetical protein VF546_25080 [Pyrinomonadaceae bacterium]|jgi:hypothetical protein